MISFTPNPKIKTSSRSAAQLARYQAMQRNNTLARDRRAWADLIRSYTIYRLDELCFANINSNQVAAQLYLGYCDWDTVRHEMRDILLFSSSDPDKLPAGAVGFIYSCPVFLVNAEYHLMLCEVTE